MKAIVSAVLLLVLVHSKSESQILMNSLEEYILKVEPDPNVARFYSLLHYSTVWINSEGNSNLQSLISEIELYDKKGLPAGDYGMGFLKELSKNIPPRKDDSLQAELRITKTAIDFYSAVAYGNNAPTFGYDGLNYKPNCLDISTRLAGAVSGHSLENFASSLEPGIQEIKMIADKLMRVNNIIHDKNFKETIISSKIVSVNNKPLILKLYQLGLIDSITGLTDKFVIEKVKDAQRFFQLLADGVLRSTILKELNIPLSVRLHQLNLSINHYRWLSCLAKSESVIVVNIPAAYLKVYDADSIRLEMRMVVGKKSTPTSALTSRINEVVLYPYWHVPYSITTKELLPKIKRNSGYINEHNYQVLNKAGKIINPYSVNWKSLSARNFPYLLRQSTGCDNALGLLKLNFYSPYGIYLHDTPIQSTFSLNKRYFSHGCMRLEQPFSLGLLVLNRNRIAIDTLEQKGCLRNQAPIVVKADQKLPVVVWYNPAGTDSTGRLVMYEDVYGKFFRKN